MQAAVFLARSGIRQTPQRIRVVEELAREHERRHRRRAVRPAARRGADIGLATVYRTLALLQRARRGGHALPPRRASSATGSAATCTTITWSARAAIASSSSRDCDLEPWVKRSAKRHGFTATDHEVEIRASVRRVPAARLRAPGRLAQLGERLPYTQGVAGSIPAPPISEGPGNRAFPFLRPKGSSSRWPTWKAGGKRGRRRPRRLRPQPWSGATCTQALARLVLRAA